MYYGESEDPYYNNNMSHYFKEYLPMDEFAKGNFSQANKIIDTYRTYLKNCMILFTRQHTGGEEEISVYLKKQLAELEQQYKGWTEKKKQAIKEIDDIQKKIDDEKKTFKEDGKANKFRDIYFNYLEKNDWNMNSLKHAFKESTKNESEMNVSETHIKELHEIFESFIISAPAHINKLEELGKEMYYAKKRRNEANHTLSHKSNRMNLEKQINDIKTGRESTGIINQIRKDIFKIFKKNDHMDHVIDNRSLQEIFTSIMTTELITNCKTDKQVKKNFIKSHTDKLGLFDHIRRIYHDNSQLFLNIETGREGSRGNEYYYRELMENKVEEIIGESKKILEKIPAISGYFRLGKDATEEEIEKRKNRGDKEWKDIVIEDMISNFREILNAPKKKLHRRQEPDRKIKKLFEGIYTVTESHEFEGYCEKLWNIDANRYWEILGTEGKILMKQIYKAMNQEERDIIASEYNTRGIYEQIVNDVLDEETKEKEKQLKIFDFAPIYNIEGYMEKIITHIVSLLGSLSFDYKWKLECIARKMFAEQGHDGYIDTGKEIALLSEEEFIKRVKESRRGKALSLRLKKFEGKLLPDINERIAEMKKTIKGDIR